MSNHLSSSPVGRQCHSNCVITSYSIHYTKLYDPARVGAKRAGDDLDESGFAGAVLADKRLDLAVSQVDDIPIDTRVDFFRRAQHCFGCSAFVMSGAGSLLFFHIGAVKAMWLEGILPDVLSGSSGSYNFV